MSCFHTSAAAPGAVAGLRHQRDSVPIGFGFVFAAELEHRQQQRGVDRIRGVDPRRGAARHADGGTRGRSDDRHRRALAADAAVLLEAVFAEVVPGFVAEHRGVLRFVAHARQEPGVHDHHPRREHRRVEGGIAHEIQAQLRRRAADEPLDDAARVGVQLRRLQQLRRGANRFFDALEALPDAAFVGVLGLIAFAHERRKIGGQQIGFRRPGHTRGASADAREEMPARCGASLSALPFSSSACRRSCSRAAWSRALRRLRACGCRRSRFARS